MLKHKRTSISPLSIAVLVIYALFAGHFIYSNFVRTIGPNIVVTSRIYCNGDVETGCLFHCPDFDLTAKYPIQSYDEYGQPISHFDSQGFPFATYALINGCPGDRVPADIDTMGFNWLYLLAITGLAYAAFTKLNNRKPNSKPKRQ